jgi:hypothetical protein
MVIEFWTSKEQLIKSKRKRFEELNTMYFMQQEMNNAEVVEWNELEQWLKIHNI